MANFSYTAVNSKGMQIRGSMESSDKDGAVQRIKEMGLFPIRIAEKQLQKTFFERFKSWFFRIEDISVAPQADPVKTEFSYTAVDARGKLCKGMIEASSKEEVVKLVRRMGYFPTRVVPA